MDLKPEVYDLTVELAKQTLVIDSVHFFFTGRRIAIFNSGIGYQILSRHTDRISDIRYRISESDIIGQMMKKAIGQLKQKTA